ncbi:MAG TPA: 2Fe-2S iron-sulfur cluster-binding protein [Polyangiaceae bacterium]
MPSFKLDDKDIPFEPGDTVIRAAHRVGVDVPHYCWHPGLSVAANCRMCLVEVMPPPGRPAMLLDVLAWDDLHQTYVPQKKPKLQPACQQAAADGMVVKSQTSEHAVKARSAVQELLLLNHPVDCPICDQAGECRLQDYWLEHQASKKRMHDEPVHKPKGVVFGPTIVYDAERCIMCTRCVRVSAELAKDPVLSMRERGNLNEITVAPGRQLDHDYTLMTEYVCPVGALTSSDFRFKARVWFLRSARSTCVGCATGCSSFSDFDPRNQKVYRYRPRENEAVNKFWMCDEGMLDYQRIHQHRVLAPLIQGESVSDSAALERAAELVKAASPQKTAILLSAEHSNEDNLALLDLGKALGALQIFYTGRAPGKGDDILMSEDKNPNVAGVLALSGGRAKPLADLASAIKDGKVGALVALGSAIGNPNDAGVLKEVRNFVALSTHEGPIASAAAVVLPASSWAEADGTFVNRQGLWQESDRAINPQGKSRPAFRWVQELAKLLSLSLPWKKVSELRSLSKGPTPPATTPSAPPPGAE